MSFLNFLGRFLVWDWFFDWVSGDDAAGGKPGGADADDTGLWDDPWDDDADDFPDDF